MALKNRVPTAAAAFCLIFLSTDISAQDNGEEIKKSQLLVPMAPAAPDPQVVPKLQSDKIPQLSQVAPEPTKTTAPPEYKKAKKEQSYNPK
ncbi:MAG: hypothetical protein P8N12_02770 [Porticoccaceae bacterium]|nr:hypothetical protein [Porticoccaceae bacterium]